MWIVAREAKVVVRGRVHGQEILLILMILNAADSRAPVSAANAETEYRLLAGYLIVFIKISLSRATRAWLHGRLGLGM